MREERKCDKCGEREGRYELKTGGKTILLCEECYSQLFPPSKKSYFPVLPILAPASVVILSLFISPRAFPAFPLLVRYTNLMTAVFVLAVELLVWAKPAPLTMREKSALRALRGLFGLTVFLLNIASTGGLLVVGEFVWNKETLLMSFCALMGVFHVTVTLRKDLKSHGEIE